MKDSEDDLGGKTYKLGVIGLELNPKFSNLLWRRLLQVRTISQFLAPGLLQSWPLFYVFWPKTPLEFLTPISFMFTVVCSATSTHILVKT